MKFEKEFRKDHPETIGETDKNFDLANYNDWLNQKYEDSISLNKELLDFINEVSKTKSNFDLYEIQKNAKDLINKSKL